MRRRPRPHASPSYAAGSPRDPESRRSRRSLPPMWVHHRPGRLELHRGAAPGPARPGVGPGDEVSGLPFIHRDRKLRLLLGATPIFADVDPLTYNLDPRMPSKRPSRREPRSSWWSTRSECRSTYEPFLEIGERHGIKILEDAACAIGSKFLTKVAGNRSVGALGNGLFQLPSPQSHHHGGRGHDHRPRTGSEVPLASPARDERSRHGSPWGEEELSSRIIRSSVSTTA